MKYLLGLLLILIFNFNLLSKPVSEENSNLKVGVVIQPLFNALIFNEDTVNTKINFLNRRLRLIAQGNLNDKINFFFQLGFSPNDFKAVESLDGTPNNPVFDAYFDYQFNKEAYIRIGQFKLPGNFSRLMSFKNLSFLERSNAENLLKIYRDIGLLTFNSFEFNDIICNTYFSLTHGEGVNSKTKEDLGLNYTARIEFLPFGKFSNDNLMAEMDKVGENSIKLLLGSAFNYNENTLRQYSTTGKKLLIGKNIESYFFDILMKYQGLSLFFEYLGKQANNNQALNPDSLAFEGYGYSISITYKLFENNFIGLRFCQYSVDKDIKSALKLEDQKDFSLSYNYYLLNERLKLQCEADYIQPNLNTNNSSILKFNLQFVLTY